MTLAWDRTGPRCVVAMSGGVDSSLAAALVAAEGWQAVGVTLKLLPRADTGFGCCGSPADIDDARKVCERLGIPHYVLDMAELFEDKVIKPFVASYLDSRTPNPCVECNRSLKFGHLLALAEAWGAQALATGHYARARQGRLFAARDLQKDQSYFLYALGARELGKVSFPVGELTKAEVREQARSLGLGTADKPESQEICFVPRRNYGGFIESRLGTINGERGKPALAALNSGPIKDASGRELGEHKGLAFYTIGQRKGLGLSGGEPRYVIRMEPENNTLVVGSDRETLASEFRVTGVSWTRGRPPEDPRAAVRIRHRHAPAGASLSLLSEDEVMVRCDEPQRAVTAGQAAVFYGGDEVLGGGTIARREGP